MAKWLQAALGVFHRKEPIIYERVKTDSLDLGTLAPQELAEIGDFLDVLVVRLVSLTDQEYFVRHTRRGTIEFDGSPVSYGPDYNTVLAAVRDVLGGNILASREEIQLGDRSYLRSKIGLGTTLSMNGLARAVNGYKKRVYEGTPSPEKPIKHIDSPSAAFSNVPEDVYNKYRQGLNLTVEK